MWFSIKCIQTFIGCILNRENGTMQIKNEWVCFWIISSIWTEKMREINKFVYNGLTIFFYCATTSNANK